VIAAREKHYPGTVDRDLLCVDTTLDVEAAAGI
jgi:hypothetical protein